MDPDIALFADVVAAGSLTGAARARAISPAMVSKRIARLEARLGVRLLDRTTRSLALTPRGERFHGDIVGILDALGAAEARISTRTVEPAGLLRISAPTSFGRLHVASCLTPFLDAHPRVELAIDLSDGFEDLGAAQVDLAIRITGQVPSGFTAHRLADNHRILCAAPAYLAEFGTPRTIADLAHHRLLAAAGQLPWRLGGDAVVAGESRIATNSSEMVRELCIAGAGIALRSLWDIGDALADGRLVRVLPDHAGSRDTAIQAVHVRGRASAAASALIDHLRATWQPVPPWETVAKS